MADPREALILAARAMARRGLNRGTSGNLSLRGDAGQTGDGFWITPTGMDYDSLEPEDIPWMDLSGEARGRRAPSSEWRFHRDIYASRPEAGAVLHAHSPFAVSLACLREDIPPFHYMIARFGGDTLRCGQYATFGTQALSDHTLAALSERQGCLMANHGMVVVGSSLREALALGEELETLCEQYWRACQLGRPVLLTPEEMADALARFAGYGRQPDPAGT